MDSLKSTYRGLTQALDLVAPVCIADAEARLQYLNALASDYLNLDTEKVESLEELGIQKEVIRDILTKARIGRSWTTIVRIQPNGSPEFHTIRFVPISTDEDNHIMLVFEGRTQVGSPDGELLNAINENLQVGLYRTTASGEFLFINKAMAKLFAYDKEEQLLLKNAQDLYLDPGRRAELQCRMDQDGKLENQEVMLKRCDGSVFWGLLVTSKLTDAVGRVVYDGGLIDITSFKELESKLKVEKQRAEAASRDKEQFLSTMSHELRTPMNAVIGLTYLLLGEDPKPEQVKNLKILRFSAENLLSIINDILDFSKIEAGKLELNNTNFEFEKLMRNIHESFAIKGENKGISMVLDLDSEIPQVLYADNTRLSQILNNLLSNAVKFTYQGEVKIACTLHYLRPDKCSIRFSVKDSGIGIPKEKLNSIFELFTQASSSITRQYGGTGLGLTITKRLIELFGGRLEVISQPGFGSEFFFTVDFELPRKWVQTTENEELRDNSLEGCSILIVEDNEVNQILLKKFLSNWGADFRVAENGKAALEELKETDFDLILMDLQMPVMDGYTATRAIRSWKEKKYQEIPILAVTASAMIEVRKKVEDAGMTDYVIKPFSPEQLYRKIHRNMPRANSNQTS